MASLSDEKLWEYIRKCKVETLKSILKKAGVPVSANKAALQKRLYYSIRLGLEVLPTQEDEDQNVAKSHLKKLKVGDITLPHPLTLEGWDSVIDMTTTNTDIEKYFQQCNQREGIPTAGKKALGEGMSLCLSQHVNTLEYHSISPIVGICYVKGYVIPQMRLMAEPYLVWVSVFKATGVIFSGDCHCIAGVSGMCKHVAALLYSTVQAGKQGASMASTSKLQTWHKPTGLADSAALSEVKTPKAGPAMAFKMKTRRDTFDPRPMTMRGEKSLQDFNLDALSDATGGRAAALLYAGPYRKPHAPLFDEPDLSDVSHELCATTTYAVPDVLTTFIKDNPSSPGELITILANFDQQGRDELVAATVKQSESDIWMNQRRGRITASIMGTVLDHVNFNYNITGQLLSIVSGIMGYYPPAQAPALKHGKTYEPVARKMYSIGMKQTHKCLKVEETGMWVSHSHPFISASPDGLVSCECCGDGILEIKCPYSAAHMSIMEYAQGSGSSRESGPVTYKGSKLSVNENHHYFLQIQTQLFCTNRVYCDLVIFLPHGSSKDISECTFRIYQNKRLIASILAKSKAFFCEVVFEELKSQKYLKMRNEKKAETKHST